MITWAGERSLELAYNYIGKRLRAVAQLDGYDTYEEGAGQLDFSGEQTLFLNLKLNVRLTNLTNSQEVIEMNPAGNILNMHRSWLNAI